MKNDNPTITFWIERNLEYRKPSIWNLWNLLNVVRSARFLVYWDNSSWVDGWQLLQREKLIATGGWLSEAMMKMEKKMRPYLRHRYRVRYTKYAPSSSQIRIVETKIAVFRPSPPPAPPKGE
jgi:hypothetical protein